MFFSSGSLCPVLQRAPQPCYRSRCSSPRNILAWERKRKEMDRPPFAINLSACLGRMVALALLPVMLFYYHSLFFCVSVTSSMPFFFPFPLPPVTRLFTLSLTVKDGEECQTFVFILICFCSFTCFSRCFLLFCCFPAARPLLSWLSFSRGARPRRLFNFNRRPRGKISFLLMCAHASAHCFLVFI